MAFIYAKLFKGYETHHKNRAMKESKPRLSRRMARQLVKNLILMMEIETLVTRAESAEADKIRAKYLREINKRREIEQSTQN